MFRLNVSDGYDSYTQLNNLYVKTITGEHGATTMQGKCMCNVTTMVMSLLYSGWKLPSSDMWKQPEDDLCDFIISRCIKPDSWFAIHYPAYYKDWYINGASWNAKTQKWEEPIWPNELHDVLAHYTCEWIGCTNAVKFTDQLAVRDFFKQIYYNRCAIPTSVAWGKIVGHVVSMVGVDAENEPALVDWMNGAENCPIVNVIYDDPYNKFVKEDQRYDHTKSGNDNIISMEDFYHCVKPLDKKLIKYAHVIAKPAALA